MDSVSSMDATDRISELPQPILQHIMSFLVVKAVVRMSTLSKSNVWNSAWNSLLSLNFGDKFFSNSVSEKTPPKLVKFVDQTLANRRKENISVQKFWIVLSYRPQHEISYVDDWISTLVACNIKELNLRIRRPVNKGICGYNQLTEAIFNAKALNVLKLNGFKVKLPSNGVIMLSSLREFHLCDAFLDGEFIQALCTSCSNLEVLSLQCFDGLTRFQVGETCLTKLKKVNLEFCPSGFELVDIASINLEELKISSHGDLKVINITACKALKSLFLNGVPVTENWLEELFYSLQNLEKFELFWCKTLKSMKITSNRLKHLIVNDCVNLIAVELDTPNLKRFEFDCHSLPTLKLNASVSLVANISFASAETREKDGYLNLANFLSNFNPSMAIELTSENDKVIVIPKDVRENLVPPLIGAKCVHVNIKKRLNYSVVDVVDSLIWICPQLGRLYFCETLKLKTIEFVYPEDASDKEEKHYCYCESLPWKCQVHKFKNIKLRNFTKKENLELGNYFFQKLWSGLNISFE